MRARAAFLATTRAGHRAGTPALVVHLAPAALPAGKREVGFIVTRSVGSAVARNRLRRRLRHLVRARLAGIPDGSRVVVRANPAAALLSSAVLGEQLDRALARAARTGVPA